MPYPCLEISQPPAGKLTVSAFVGESQRFLPTGIVSVRLPVADVFELIDALLKAVVQDCDYEGCPEVATTLVGKPVTEMENGLEVARVKPVFYCAEHGSAVLNAPFYEYGVAYCPVCRCAFGVD